MRLLSWIVRLLGLGPVAARREDEQDFPLYVTRLEDRQVLDASFNVTGGNSVNLTAFDGASTQVTAEATSTGYTFTLNGGNWTGADGSGVAGQGTPTLTIDTSAGNINGTITVNDTSGGDVMVFFTNTGAADPPNANIVLTSVGNVTINGDPMSASLDITAPSITINSNVTTSGAESYTADSIAIAATANLNASSATVTLKPLTNGREIDLGTETAGKLSLTDAELDRITAPQINIGNANSGAITISAAISRSAPTNLKLTGSSASMTASSSSLDLNGGTLSVINGAGSTGTLTLSKTLKDLSISSGTTVTATGNSTLTGVTLAGQLNINQNVTVTVNQGLTLNNGTVQLNGFANGGSLSAARLLLAGTGTQTLGGTGQVIMSGSFINFSAASVPMNVLDSNAGPLTLASGIAVVNTSGCGVVGNVGQALTINGTVTASAGQTINITGSSVTNNGPGSGSASLQANGGTLGITNLQGNAGNINSTSGTVTLSGTWTNTATNTITANGGTLTLSGTWQNAGTVIENAATVNLNGAMTIASVGALSLTNGTVNLNGTITNDGTLTTLLGGVLVNVNGTITNTGVNLSLNTSWNLGGGGSIVGGTVTTPGTTQLTATGNSSLTGVTLAGKLSINQNVTVTVNQGLTLDNGTVQLNGFANGGSLSAARLLLAGTGTQTLGGTGQVIMAGSFINFSAASVPMNVLDSNAGPLTLASGIAVVNTSGCGVVGNVGQALTINGTVTASGGQTINITGSSVTNNGPGSGSASLQANGGTLGITNLQGNAGNISATSGGTVTLSGTWQNNGTITENASTVNLNGAMTIASIGTLSLTAGTVNLNGTITNDGTLGTVLSGATVNVTGTITNTGVNLTLNNSWNLSGGSIVGGTVTTPGTTQLTATGNSTLTGVTLAGKLSINQNRTVTVNQGLTLDNGTVQLNGFANGGSLSAARLLLAGTGTQTLDGTGQVIMAGSFINFSAASVPMNVLDSNAGSLTLASGITVVNTSGHGVVGNASQALTINGTVTASGGQTINITGSTVTNTGTLQATNNGVLQVVPTPTNFASGTLTGGTWHAAGGGDVRLPTGIAIQTLNATVILDGAGSNLESGVGVDALAPLATIGSGGSMSVQNGRNFSTADDLANNGILNVGAGSRFTVTGDSVFDSTAALGIHLNSPYATAAVDYGQLKVNGTLALSNSALNLTGGAVTPSAGTVVRFIDVGMARTGFFNGLNEGNTVNVGNFTGTLSYAGIDGNDVILTAVNAVADLAISPPNITQNESHTGATTTYTYTVTRTGSLSGIVMVDWAVSGDGATPASAGDFEHPTVPGLPATAFPSGTLTFADGDDTETITVKVLGDTIVEPDENFKVVLSGALPSGTTISTDTASGTIANDDVDLAIAADPPTTRLEGNVTNTDFTFTVTRTGNLSGTTTVDYEIDLPSSVATGVDFSGALTGTLTFDPNETSRPITITAAADSTVEPDEAFVVRLFNASDTVPTNAVDITTATASATIANDDIDLAIAADPPTTRLEGNVTNTDFTFTVTRTGNLTGTTTVDYEVDLSSSTANAADFETPITGMLTFGPNVTSQQITITAAADSTVEPDEAFVVRLLNASDTVPTNSIDIATATAMATIANDDASVSISPYEISQPEGDTGLTQYTFTVTRTGNLGGTTTVDYTVGPYVGAVATPSADGDDFGGAFPTGQVVFLPGEVTQSITVDVAGDSIVELTEEFTITLSNAQDDTNAVTIDVAEADGVIENDDSALFNITDETAAENAAAGKLTFTVTLTNPVDVATSVRATTSNGSATTGDSDYLFAQQVLSFAAGETSKSFEVTLTPDMKVEGDETFTVTLDQLSDGGRAVTIGDGSGAGTIENDDAATLTIGNVSLTEGDSGTQQLDFTVTLSAAVQGGVNVDAATADGTGGTAATTADQDYDAKTETLMFAGTANESKTFSVTVRGDAKVEAHEFFRVLLSGVAAQGAGVDSADITTVGSPATGTINNNDTATLTIGNVSLTEGDSGTQLLDFTITLSNAVQGGVNVQAATADGIGGTAATTADLDYDAKTETLMFSGTANETKTFSVTVRGDAKVEFDELFQVLLSDVQAQGAGVASANITRVGSPASGTITNNDTALITITPASVTQIEGTGGTTTAYTYTVTLSNPISEAVTVRVKTADGSAQDDDPTSEDNDYTAVDEVLTFAAGASGAALTQQVTVFVNHDNKVEPDETFTISLSEPTFGGVADVSRADLDPAASSASGTIENDDTATINVGDISFAEDGTFTFTLSIDKPTSQDITVRVDTADGTAAAGAVLDYTAISNQTVTFTAGGALTQTVFVTVNDDNIVENNETFFLDLTDAKFGDNTDTSRVVIGDNQGQATIENNDKTNITIDDLGSAGDLINEGDPPSAATPFVFTISLSNPVAENVTVTVNTAGVTAAQGTDYTGIVGQTLTFTAGGSLTQQVTVNVLPDHLYEGTGGDETFQVNLTNALFNGVADATRVEITDAQGIGTITNDDTPVLVRLVETAPASGIFDLVITDEVESTGAANDLTISRSGANIVITDNAGGTGTLGTGSAARSTTVTVPLASVTGNIQVQLRGGDDKLIVDFSGGNPLPSGGLSFDAAAGSNILAVKGAGATTAEYTPSSTAGAGTISTLNAALTRSISFTGISGFGAGVDISGMTAAALKPPGLDDTLTVEGGSTDTDFYNAGTMASVLALRVSGTSAGAAIVPVAFFNNTTLTIDTTGALIGDDDTIAVARADNGHANANLSITTGAAGTDAVNINGPISLTGSLTITTDVTTLSGGAVTTGGSQTYDSQVTLGASATLTSGGVIEFKQTVDGPFDLELAGTGSAIARGAVGATTAVGDGTGASLVLNMTGPAGTEFQSTVRTAQGITQANTAGPAIFRENVTVLGSAAASAFDANVTLDGLTFASAGAVTFGNAATDSLTISGVATTISTTGAGNVTLSATTDGQQNLTLNAAGGITFNAPVTMAADKNLAATSTSTTLGISLATTSSDIATSGTGAVSLTATRNISLASGSSIRVVNGNLTLNANLAGTATGDFHGISLTGASLTTTGQGNVLLTGQGGTGAANRGILVYDGSDILTSGTVGAGLGQIELTGTGGTHVGGANFGIEVRGTGVTSKVRSTGSGGVELSGVGGTGGGGNHGILLYAEGSHGGRIESTSTGTITLTGVGGAGAGGNHDGVRIDHETGIETGVISSGSGDVTIVGAAGVGAGGTAVELINSGAAAFSVDTSVGTATVSVIGDSMAIGANTGIQAGANTVTLRPAAAADIAGEDDGDAIHLGSAVDSTANTLELTDAELDRISAGTLQIGDTTSGPITVSEAISRPAATIVNLTTGANNIIAFTSAGALDSAGGNVTLTTSGTGAITSGTATTDITSGAGTISLRAGSGGIGGNGIGASNNPLVLAGANLNTATTGDGNQFLGTAGSITIDATGVSAGTGTVELNGAGTFALGGSDRINNTAKLNVNGPTFAIGAFDETVDTLTLTAGNITGTTGALTSTNTIQTKSGSASAILAGTNGLNQSTSGTTVLSGVNTYTGGTTVDDGVLSISADRNLGAVPGVAGTNITLAGGTLRSTTNDVTLAANRSILLAAASTVESATSAKTLDIGGTIDGAQTLTLQGSGHITLSGVVGGVTPLTSLLDNVTGTTTINTSSVATTTFQTYANSVALAANTTLIGSIVTFNGTVDGQTHSLDIGDGTTATNAVLGDGSADTVAGLTTLRVRGTTAIHGASVTSSGTQQFDGAATLGTNVSLVGSTVTFLGTVTGASHSLDIGDATTATNAVLGDAAADTVAGLTTLRIRGTTAIHGASVTSSGTQQFDGAATLGTNVSLIGSTVTFKGTVDGTTHSLDIGNATTATNAVLGDAAADTVTGLTTLRVRGTTAIHGASVTSSGTQQFDGAATLGTDVTLTASTVTFHSTVDGTGVGTEQLDVQANATLNAVVGNSKALERLNISGATTLNAAGTTPNPTVKTTGAQTYVGAVSLSQSTVLTSTAAGNVSFSATVNGGQTLAVNTSGTTTMGGAVGLTTALTSLTTDGGGTTAVNGGAVKTTGAQTYGDAVTLDAAADATTFTSGGLVTFASTLDGAAADTEHLVVAANVEFDDAVGATARLASLSVVGTTLFKGGVVNTSGSQDYTGAATLAADLDLNVNASGSVTFNSTVDDDATAGGANMTVNTAGNGVTTFAAAVGDTFALTSLTTNADGTTEINGGAVTTVNAQTYHDDVTFGDTTELKGSHVAFDKTAAAAANDLAITADEIDLIDVNAVIPATATVSGSGNLILRPRDPAATIGVGGGAGTLDLSDDDLAALVDGFSLITIGRTADGTGQVSVESATFRDDLLVVGGAIDVTALDVGGNDVELHARHAATGTITDRDGGTAADITAANVTLAAIRGIGASGAAGSIEVDADDIVATNLTSGGIFINSVGTGGVLISATAATAGSIGILSDTETVTLRSVSAAAGDVSATVNTTTGEKVIATLVSAGGNVSLSTVVSGDVELGDVTAGVTATVNAADAIKELSTEPAVGLAADEADVTAATVTLLADKGIGSAGPAGSIEVDADTITATNTNAAATVGRGIYLRSVGAGGVSITADAKIKGDIEILGASETVTLADLATADGNILAELTGRDLIAQLVTAGKTAVGIVTSGNGNVTLKTFVSGDIHVGSVVAIVDEVRLTSASSVVDGDTAGDDTDVTAARLIASAAGTIGTSVNRLETAVSNFEATAGSNVHLVNAGNLTIGEASAMVGITAGGNVHIEAQSDLTVKENITAAQITGIASGRASIVGATVTSSSGVVRQIRPAVSALITPQINAEGLAEFNIHFGVSGETNYTLTIDWRDGTVETFTGLSAGPHPFSHSYFLHPALLGFLPGLDAASPIPITFKLENDPNINFFDGRATTTSFLGPTDSVTETGNLSIVTGESQAEVPGEGLGGKRIDTTPQVAMLGIPRVSSADALRANNAFSGDGTRSAEVRAAVADLTTAEDDAVILEVISADGQLVDRISLRLDVLKDLDALYRRLPDGKYRLLLRRDGREIPIFREVLFIRGGKIIDPNQEGTQEKPPGSQVQPKTPAAKEKLSSAELDRLWQVMRAEQLLTAAPASPEDATGDSAVERVDPLDDEVLSRPPATAPPVDNRTADSESELDAPRGANGRSVPGQPLVGAAVVLGAAAAKARSERTADAALPADGSGKGKPAPAGWWQRFRRWLRRK